jgi:hypothetical protein
MVIAGVPIRSVPAEQTLLCDGRRSRPVAPPAAELATQTAPRKAFACRS